MLDRLGFACRHHRAATALALAAFALTGCSINPQVDLGSMTAGASAPVVFDVPFYPQTKYQCGPAALAGLLNASGVETSAEALTGRLYLPERKGSLQIELVSATRSAGRIAYVIEDDLQIVVDQVLARRPVLVLQNLGTRHFPAWHYAVVVGVDEERNHLVLNTGADEKRRVEADSFMRTWDWAGRWALVALEPGEIPVSADATTYAMAVSEFEATAGWEAAYPAWLAAREQWPGDARWSLALGNQAFERGEQEAAIKHYIEGLRLEPGHPVLSNNLAMALGDLGCVREGEMVLEGIRGIQHDASPWNDAIEETRKSLAARSQAEAASCNEFPVDDRSDASSNGLR